MSSRLCGAIIALAEIVMLIVPYNITSYTPKYFYGALLLLIAIELLSEWLVFRFHQMPFLEFMICWATFIAVQIVGIELGMIAGVALSTLEFLVSYYRRRQPHSSRISEVSSTTEIDPITVRVVIEGYIYFGNAITTLRSILEINQVKELLKKEETSSNCDLITKNEKGSKMHYELIQATESTSYGACDGKTEAVRLDFSNVIGVDVTAMNSCFLMLAEALRKSNIRIYFDNDDTFHDLFVANHIIVDE